ncbi:MAG: polysaccharide deacetylase family protein [Thiocapsa sp.]|uniref:polysaccharide deacetylase family protein n=1 Tax=Thiocapsa sp. TaxID=2024551 RepID=UPI001BCFF92B|nr:polysaccharide deacetylase family protein [Thiocapsa sp.]QVL49807.1 MAG: polysaccharide deacetylase family protein [Thiocapsa sp.]
MTLIVETPGTHPAERDYILGVILGDFLGISWQRAASTDGDAHLRLRGDDSEIVLPDIFFSQSDPAWLTAATLPRLPLATWGTRELAVNISLTEPVVPVICGAAHPILRRSGQTIELPIDIFGSAFFMLSRYEEAILPDRDNHNRFPAMASLANRAGFLGRPIVDEYVEVLWAAMQQLWPSLKRKPRAPRTLVSHDVDCPSRDVFASPFQVLLRSGADLLKRRDLANAVRRPWRWIASGQRIRGSDPDNTFDWLMDQSEHHGLTSAFYFMSRRTHARFDVGYRLEHPAIRQLLRHIHVRGHEIGLHPSYNSYHNPLTIEAEATRLKGVCAEEGIEQAEWGGRMHYLRWEMPTTLLGLEQAGMTYDSTLSYADRPGFRCGTCHEYPAFDPVRSQALKLRIRPLIAMECTVMAERYMGLGTTAAAYEAFMKLKRACETVDGDFTLLWHNTQLASPQERELYQAIIV